MKRNESVPGGNPPWRLPSLERPQAIHLLACLGISVILLLFLGPGALATRWSYADLAPGQVADKDLVAAQDVVYVDKEATRLRIEAEERLVLPVFQLDEKAGQRALSQFTDFSETFRSLSEQNIAQETAILMLESRFPGLVPHATLLSLASSSLKSQILVYAQDVLGRALEKGIFNIPGEGLSRYNPDYFELRRRVAEKTSMEQRPRASMVTKANLAEAIAVDLSGMHLAKSLTSIVQTLAAGFAVENAFFDETYSAARLKKVAASVEPVSRRVSKNEVIVKAGQLLSEDDYQKILTIRKAMSTADIGLSLRGLGILASAAALAFLILSKRGSNRSPEETSLRLLGIYGALAFYLIALLAARSGLGSGGIRGAYLLPAALFTGIAAAMAGSNFGFLYSIILCLLTASASNIDPLYTTFVLLAGLFSSFTVTTAKTRLELVRAGLLQAGIQFLIAVLLLAGQGMWLGELLVAAGFLALNGFAGGVLILAILPVLEQSLNLPTRFRLLELSDVNSPALKDLLSQAPGTYAHSINVAHLAEAAAEDLGADALLARVGAYYHDLGKLDQPEYYIENQKGTNKHDELNPRLSATVIRSHVKLGMERAKELKLPRKIVDIVGQHHGNSVIAWFYDKAKSMDESVKREDFSYPGSPPAGKEAGIVMLADAVEASARTIKQYSLPRLDAHVRQIISDKIKEGQLDRCALTIEDLDTIRKAFVRILAGQYHSRIEYPAKKEGLR